MDYIDTYLIDDGIRKKSILACVALGCAIILFNVIFKPKSLLVVILLYILAALILLAGVAVHIYIKNRNIIVLGIKPLLSAHEEKYEETVTLYEDLTIHVEELNSKISECNRLYDKLNRNVGWKAWKKIKHIDKFQLQYRPDWNWIRPRSWNGKYELTLRNIFYAKGYLQDYSDSVQYYIERLDNIDEQIRKKDEPIFTLLKETDIQLKLGNNIDYSSLREIIDSNQYNNQIMGLLERINLLRKNISRAENALRKIL